MIGDLLTGRVAKDSDIQLRIVEYALSPKTISRLHQVCRDLRDMHDDIYQMANASMFGSARVHAPLASSRQLYNIMVKAFSGERDGFYDHEADSFAYEHEFVDSANLMIEISKPLFCAPSELDRKEGDDLEIEGKCPCCRSSIVVPDFIRTLYEDTSLIAFAATSTTKEFFSKGLPEMDMGRRERLDKSMPTLSFKCHAECGYRFDLEFPLKLPSDITCTNAFCSIVKVDRFLAGEQEWMDREDHICDSEKCKTVFCDACYERGQFTVCEKCWKEKCKNCSCFTACCGGLCNDCGKTAWCGSCGQSWCNEHGEVHDVIELYGNLDVVFSGGAWSACKECRDGGVHLE